MMNIARDLSKCVVCNEMEVIGRRKRRFYRFPRDTGRCRAWIRAIGMESLVYMPLEELYEQVVCDTHFPQHCFSAQGSRLHKVTLPTISQYPSLSDNIMALWPKSAMRVNPPETCGVSVSAQPKEAEMDRLNNDRHIIDFNQPLMTCLGTIEHNERHRVKKPAGILNTISVPLMTYSSSLEQGTIFAAPEAKNIDFSKLPTLDLQYDDEMRQTGDENTETEAFQEVVTRPCAPTQHKNKNHKDGVTGKDVVFGVATTICSNKIVQTATNQIVKSNKTIKSLNISQSEVKCKINSIHYFMNHSQFDQSKIFRNYKPIKKSITPKLPKSDLVNVPNTSNMVLLNRTMSKKPEPIKDADSGTELPLDSELPEWNTGGFTYTKLIVNQSYQKEHPQDVERESPESYTHVGKNTDYGLPHTQSIDTVKMDEGKSKMKPITQIDVTVPLMRCTDIIDLIDQTK